MDFDLFGYHFNTETFVFLGVVFFLGLTFGWFFRKPMSLFGIVLAFTALVIFAPMLDFMIAADYLPMTLSFILGFLVHTAKPIYTKLTS